MNGKENRMIYYGYQRCSTSRKGEKWLQDRGISYEFKDLSKETPSAEALEKWHKISGKDIKKFFNTSGMKYRELDLKNRLTDMSDEEKYRLLASDGMLIKRPMIVDGDEVLIGFAEKEWQSYFNKGERI